MSKHNILESNVYGGSDREMGDDHAVWLSSVLMKNDHIGEVFVSAEVDEVFQNIATSVDSFGVGHYNGHLLEELQQSG